MGESFDGPAGERDCTGGGTREKNAAKRAFSRRSEAFFGLVALEWSVLLVVAAVGVVEEELPAALVEGGGSSATEEALEEELEAGLDCEVAAERNPTKFSRAAISSLVR